MRAATGQLHLPGRGVTDPYVRVYQSIFDDPKFVGIVDDDHHLATWLRLLMYADPTWPLAAPLPATARKSSVKALLEAGLIDVTGGRYRIHGLDAEREKRAAKARASADKRWSDGSASGMRTHSERNANAQQVHSDSNARASVSVSDKEEIEEPARADDRDAQDRFYELTSWRPWGNFSGEQLRAASRDYGDPIVTSALEAEYGKDGTRDTLLKRTLARLAREADRRREEAKARPQRIRKSPEEVEAEYRENKRLELMIVNGELT